MTNYERVWLLKSFIRRQIFDTQIDLAKRIGCTKYTLNKWLAKKNKISKAYQLRVDELIKLYHIKETPGDYHARTKK